MLTILESRHFRSELRDGRALSLLPPPQPQHAEAEIDFPKTVSSAPKDRAQMALAAAFLQDDQSGRLRTNETTETLAALTAVDPNPAFDLFQDLIAHVKSSKPRDGKADSKRE